MKKLFLLLVLFAACGRPDKPIENKAIVSDTTTRATHLPVNNTSKKDTGINVAKKNVSSPVAHGAITGSVNQSPPWYDAPPPGYGIFDLVYFNHFKRIRDDVKLSEGKLSDSLTDPKVYLYSLRGIYQYLVVFTNNKIDTFQLGERDAEVTLDSISLSSIQLNNKGNKEVVVDVKYKWGFDTYGLRWEGQGYYSYKLIIDVDEPKLLFSAMYYRDEEYNTVKAEHDKDGRDGKFYYRYGLDISEDGLLIKNYTGYSKPDHKMGFYEWRDSAFAYTGKQNK